MASHEVAVIPREAHSSLWDAVQRGIADDASQSRTRLAWSGPAEEDPEKQIAALEKAIEDHSQGVIVAPAETLAFRSPVLRAVRQGIPVVVVDDELGPQAGPLLSYVSTDEQAGAQMAAQEVAKVVGDHGSIAIMGISPRLESGLSRAELFESALHRYARGIQVQSRRFGDSVLTHEQQIAEVLLQRNEPVDAIVALTGTATRGAYYAKLASGAHPAVAIIGFDQDLPSALQSGAVTAIVVQDGRRIGQAAMAHLRAEMAGHPVEAHTQIAPLLLRAAASKSEAITGKLSPKLSVSPETQRLQSSPGSEEAALTNLAKTHEVQPGVQPIVNFLLAPGQHPDVAIQGVVISSPPLIAIQDDSGAMIIPDVSPDLHLHPGDVVEATGTVVSERFRSRMQDARIRVLWSETPVPRLAVTALQLTSGTYRGRAIEVEGVLLHAHRSADGYDMELQDADQVFRAVGPKNLNIEPRDLEAGTRLRLRGMATSLPQFTLDEYPFAIMTEAVEVVSSPPWWSPRHVLLLALACVGLLTGLLFSIHKFQAWLLRTRLREREELAFEMHDTLAQSFTGIAYQLQAASMDRRGPEMMQRHLESALQMVHESHREASRTIAALRPQLRDTAGILSALKSLAERLSDNGDLVVTNTLVGKGVHLPIDVTDAFFRIGQEAVSNAIQHGHCRSLQIILRLSWREAQLTVEDDGSGFAEQNRSNGLGLASMRARAAKIKATFDLTSAVGKGTVICVTWRRSWPRLWPRALRFNSIANLLPSRGRKLASAERRIA